jgi:diguanylate cyclase (GGDEF)-like protein
MYAPMPAPKSRRTRTPPARRAAGAALIGVVAAAVAAASAGGEVAWLCAALSLVCAIVLRQRLATLERERDTLRRDALSDPVTGVANRRSLLARTDYEIARHRRAGQSFALVMLDLDGFKQLNDRFGHAAGDDLLRDVAGALRRDMRAQDTVARFGGDEFCVLAPETDEHGTARLAAKVTKAVRDVSVGMDAVAGSVGVALFPADGRSAAELMHAADERLLEAKRRRPAGNERPPTRVQRRAA